MMRGVTCLLGTVLLFGCTSGRKPSEAQKAPHHIVFARFEPVNMQLFVANGDGSGERPLMPMTGKDYAPSFSADGQWIVFTSERAGSADIYRIHPDGTGVERLTDDPSYEDQAVLSPDGKTLAFVSTRGSGRAHVWLMDLATRRARVLTESGGGDFRPAWSPDGRWIAFTSDRERTPVARMGQWELIQWNALFVIRADGTGLRRLTSVGAQKEVAGAPRWSPDGSQIIYYETTADGAYHAQMGTAVRGTTQLVSIDVKTLVRTGHTEGDGARLFPQMLADGSIRYLEKFSGGQAELHGMRGSEQLFATAKAKIRNPSWSPDGKYVAYHKVLPDQSASEIVPAFSRDPDFELSLTNSWFETFSPRGDKLAVAPQRGSRIEVSNPDGTSRQVVFNKDGAQVTSPAWSPDGRQIAFGVGRYFRAPRYPAGELAVVGADGTGYRSLDHDGANNGFPTWSPDGTRIVYKKNQHLAILNLATGSVADLTPPAPYHDNFPQWSPKGDIIVFVSDRDRDGDFRLYSIRPDGTDLHMLPNSTPGDGHPAFSPDGSYIMFSSARMGFKDERALAEVGPQPYGELFIMHPDGTGLRQLTDNQWEDALPTWLPDRTQVETRRIASWD